MKTTVRIILISIISVVLLNCRNPKPEKSIANLKIAFNDESLAGDKYAKYAKAAMKEGFDTIAKLFEAASKSEYIHAMNHAKVFEKFDGNALSAEIASYEVKTTAENIQDAIKVESYEMQTMYPRFIREAENEKAAEAAKSFTWSMDADKKHLNYYRKALANLTNGSKTGISTTWTICPTCGNMYPGEDLSLICDFCLTKQEKILGFEEKPEETRLKD